MQHCTCRTLLRSVFNAPSTRASTPPPPFLLPAFAPVKVSSFSTTTAALARKDGNPNRGVSALRRTGLGKRQKLSIKLEDLPKPVLDPSKRSKVQVDEDHGLWEFFPPNRQPMMTPEELYSHGRAWTVAELRNKDWNDLHRLWWVCLKEMNRIATTSTETARVGEMYGEYEADHRETQISKTMKAIRHTLTERWYAWENARVAAMEDDEINMYADLEKNEPAYVPKMDEPETYLDPIRDSSAAGNTQAPLDSQKQAQL